MTGYYTYPEFSLMPRTNYEAKINLPKDLTNPLGLFTLFYPFEYMEIFVWSTNQYAEKKIKLELKKNTSLPNYNRYLDWKSLTIKETYVFLKILILINSNRRPKIKDY